MRLRPLPLTCLLALAACGSAPAPAALPELRAGGLACWVAPDAQGRPVLVVGVEPAPGQRRPLAHTNGLYLTLKEDDDFRISLPFAAASLDGDTLRLECRPHGNHRPAVTVRAAGAEGLLVEVQDAVGLQSRVRELAIEYFLDADSPVQESYVPHVHPGPDYVAGDDSWQLPLAWLRADGHGLALLPEPVGRELRRLPQALRVDPELRRIRHGLAAQRVETGADGARLYRAAGDVDVQGETLVFRHTLLATAAAEPQRTFDALVEGLFARWSAPQLDGPGDVLPRSWQQAAADLAAEVAARWRPCRIAGRDVGLIAGERRGNAFRTWYTWRYQPLRTAAALHRLGTATGDERLQQQAAESVRSLLLAPSRGGLPPALIDVDPAAEKVQCGADDGAEGHAGWIRTLDASWTACWRLRARSWLPELSEAILADSRDTARFLLANQLPNGAFPTFFDAEYLAPRRQLLFDDSAESAGPALFLAEFGAATGDAEALTAAARAVQFLAAASRQRSWSDFETWQQQSSAPAPLPAAAVDGSIRWAFAALAAARLAQVAERGVAADAAAAARHFLRGLATFQQVRRRPWHPEDQVGGMTATNLDGNWNDARGGLCAEAFLAGYELTGERSWLQRAALALRAALQAPSDQDQPLAAGAHAGAVSSQIVAERWGQGVVDVGGGFAQGLDAVWLSGLQLQGDELSLQCRSDAGLERARIVFRNLGPRPGLLLRVNGQLLGFRSAADLQAGIELGVRAQPRFDFRPPAEVAGDLPWPVRVPCDGPLRRDCAVAVELRADGQLLGQVPLELGADGRTMQPALAFVPQLPVGARLRARLLVDDGGVGWTVPAVGARELTVSDFQCLDPGDDSEIYLRDGGRSRVALFADGREGCRELVAADAVASRPQMTMRVPVPPQAVRVQLDVWLRGAVRIEAEDRLLHLDDNAPAAARHLRFTVADRRLWPDGVLPVRFCALGPNLQVSRIRYRSEGDAAEPPPPGHSRRTRPPAPSLRIAVLPLQLDDLPCEATPDQLRTACFGELDYAMTPAPQPAVTTGSAATVLDGFAGGGTRLQGEVLRRLDVLLLAADLRREPDGGRRRLCEAVRSSLLATGASTDVDAVVVVHGGGDQLRVAPGDADEARPRLVFLPERSRDGSFLAGGDLLFALLHALRGLPDRRPPEHGAFGELALGGVAPAHQPAGPIALDREQLGWVDRIELDRSADLEVPTLHQDRAFLALRCSDLPGRGDLIVEGRREGPRDAGGDGLLLYWDRRQAPVLIADGDRAALVECLRLSPDLQQLPTALAFADRRDLFAPPFALGAETRPGLATPQGEVPWSLDLRSDRGRAFARIDALALDCSDWRAATWQAVSDGVAAPMPLGLDLGDRGEVAAAPDGLRVRPPAHGSIEAALTLPRRPGLQRLFVRLQATGPGATTIAVASGDRVLARATVGGAAPLQFELDAPPALQRLRLGFSAAGDRGAPVQLQQCTLVPRQPAWMVLTPPSPQPAEQPWMDGNVHSLGLLLRTDADGRARLQLPVIAGPPPMTLRLCGGLPQSTPAGARLRLQVDLAAVDGSAVQPLAPSLQLRRAPGLQPLWTALLSMPPQTGEQLRMLRLELHGPPATELWLQTVELVLP